jgi:hypothetical protein
MFQFTTTTILNTTKDSSGKPKWSSVDEATAAKSFNVKRVNDFKAESIAAVFKREASNPKLAKSVLTLDGADTTSYGAGEYQLSIHLNYQGSQNSFYATPISYTKGKPLFYAFSLDGTETAEEVGDKIVKIAKWIDTRFDQKWLNISNNSLYLTIDAIDEYQRFVDIKIERFETDPYGNAIWKTVLEGKYDGIPNPKATIDQGREGFGTYTHLLKDLRLPTAANTNWLAINQEERPIPGELYNQYTLQYVKNRGIMGQSAVGSLAVSATNHVFYVRTTISTAFEAALAAALVGSGVTISDVEGPAGYPTPITAKKNILTGAKLS